MTDNKCPNSQGCVYGSPDPNPVRSGIEFDSPCVHAGLLVLLKQDGYETHFHGVNCAIQRSSVHAAFTGIRRIMYFEPLTIRGMCFEIVRYDKASTGVNCLKSWLVRYPKLAEDLELNAVQSLWVLAFYNIAEPIGKLFIKYALTQILNSLIPASHTPDTAPPACQEEALTSGQQEIAGYRLQSAYTAPYPMC